MMKKYFILLLLISAAIFGYGQVNDQSCSVFLKAGAIIRGSLLDTIDANFSDERVSIRRKNNEVSKIPVSAIEKIVDGENNILYPFVPQKAPQGMKLFQVHLKAGAIIKGGILHSFSEGYSKERLTITKTNGSRENIPISAIEKILDQDNKVIFPFSESIPVSKTTTAPLGPKCVVNLIAGSVFRGQLDKEFTGNYNKENYRIKLLSDNGKVQQIPLKYISSIKKENGATIYSLAEIKNTPEVKEDFKEKEIVLETDAKDLQDTIIESVKGNEGERADTELTKTESQLYLELIEQKRLSKELALQVKQANCKSEQESLKESFLKEKLILKEKYLRLSKEKSNSFKQVRQENEQLIQERIDKKILHYFKNGIFLKGTANGEIQFFFNDSGYLEKDFQSVSKVNENLYQKVLDEVILPEIRLLNLKSYEALSWKKELDESIKIYKQKMASSTCDINLDIEFQIAEKEFGAEMGNEIAVGSKLKYIINYSHDYESSTVIKRKKSLVKKQSLFKREKLNFSLSQFPKNGKYTTNISSYSVNGFSATGLGRKQTKYLRYLYGGISFGTYFPNSAVSNNFSFNLFEFNYYQPYLIFRRVGAYVNIVNHNPLYSQRFEGIYLRNPEIVEGGILLGLSQNLYLKAGYCSIFSDQLEYIVTKDVPTALNENIFKEGVNVGLSIVLPFFILEAGYNSVFNSVNAGVGINIPLNF